MVALSRYVQQYEQRFLSAALTYTDDLVAKAMQRVSICEDEESLSNSVISCKFWSRISRLTIIFVVKKQIILGKQVIAKSISMIDCILIDSFKKMECFPNPSGTKKSFNDLNILTIHNNIVKCSAIFMHKLSKFSNLLPNSIKNGWKFTGQLFTRTTTVV